MEPSNALLISEEQKKTYEQSLFFWTTLMGNVTGIYSTARTLV